MQRELLLVDEMIGAAEQARALVNGVTLETLEDDRLRRDALLWNFTVIGEAASQLGPEIRSRFPDIDWAKPGSYATASFTAIGPSISRSFTRPQPTSSPASSNSYGESSVSWSKSRRR